MTAKFVDVMEERAYNMAKFELERVDEKCF